MSLCLTSSTLPKLPRPMILRMVKSFSEGYVMDEVDAAGVWPAAADDVDAAEPEGEAECEAEGEVRKRNNSCGLGREWAAVLAAPATTLVDAQNCSSSIAAPPADVDVDVAEEYWTDRGRPEAALLAEPWSDWPCAVVDRGWICG